MQFFVVYLQRGQFTAENQKIDELKEMFNQWKEEEKAEQQVSLLFDHPWDW